MSLKPKQKKFCEEYVIDFNGTQAAIRAGYSEKTARQIANQLLTKLDKKQYIEQLQEEIKERNRLKLDDVIAELRMIGFVRIDELYDDKGHFKPIHEMSDRARASIAGIKVTTKELNAIDASGNIIPYDETTKEIKLWDKRAALVDLARHLGGFEKDNQQKVLNTNVVINNNIVDRVMDKIKDI